MIKWVLNKIFWGGFRHLLSDRQYASVRYWLIHGHFPNIENPVRLSEKIQYIKLYERNSLRKAVADRIKVRNFVKNRVGEEHLIPQIAVFKELNRSNWDSLPNKFVLKASHGSGFIRIVKDKTEENFEEILAETNKWLSTDYYKFGREWVYKDLERVIIVEKLLLDESGNVPADYKFHCFNGVVKLIQVDINRFREQKRFLFTRSYKPVDATILYPAGEELPDKPAELDDAIRVAEKLSKEFTFIRVDLYLLDGKIYFGEMTNYPGNGFQVFKPESFEIEMGSHLKLD
tara:strand:+ start:48171 stop:49034 length:864 start_codon:yes stop_codon:yes gene_type:complete